MGKTKRGLHGGEPNSKQVVKGLLRVDQVLPDVEEQASHCVITVEVGGLFYLHQSG